MAKAQRTVTTESEQPTHKVVNFLPYAVQIYTEDQQHLVYEIPPSGEVAQSYDFKQTFQLPGPGRFKQAGYVPVPCKETYAQMLGKQEDQDALVYPIPVVTPVFLIPPEFAGRIGGLPRALRPEMVWIPTWYLVSEEVAKIASKQQRIDVLTWDTTTALFVEEGRVGVRRLVQW